MSRMSALLALSRDFFNFVVAVAQGFVGRPITRFEAASINQTPLQLVEWLLTHILSKVHFGLLYGPLVIGTLLAGGWRIAATISAGILTVWFIRLSIRVYLVLTRQPIFPHDS